MTGRSNASLGVNSTGTVMPIALHDGSVGIQKVDFLLAEVRTSIIELITGGIQQMGAWYGSNDEAHFLLALSRRSGDYRLGVWQTRSIPNQMNCDPGGRNKWAAYKKTLAVSSLR